jgi:hypothetical protein
MGKAPKFDGLLDDCGGLKVKLGAFLVGWFGFDGPGSDLGNVGALLGFSTDLIVFWTEIMAFGGIGAGS